MYVRYWGSAILYILMSANGGQSFITIPTPSVASSPVTRVTKMPNPTSPTTRQSTSVQRRTLTLHTALPASSQYRKASSRDGADGRRRPTSFRRQIIATAASVPLRGSSADTNGAGEQRATGDAPQELGLVLREFSIPLQESPGEYAKRVQQECAREGTGAKVIRWHISNADGEQGEVHVEAVFLTGERP